MVPTKSIMIFNSFCNMSFQIFGAGKWLVTNSTPSHYLNQCWLVNWCPRNAFKSNFINNSNIFILLKNMHLKFRLQHMGHFVQLSMSHKVLKYFDIYFDIHSQPSHNYIRLLSTMSWLNYNMSRAQFYNSWQYIWLAKKASHYGNINKLTHRGLVHRSTTAQDLSVWWVVCLWHCYPTINR